jgi:putative transposase
LSKRLDRSVLQTEVVQIFNAAIKSPVTRDVYERLKSLLKEKCKQLKIDMLSLETMLDHVRLFVRAEPTISPNRIIATLIGYTSRVLREEFVELRCKLPTLWSRSYFVSTHGHVSTETIEKHTYKFRIYPNRQQVKILSQTIGTCRSLYNQSLEERLKDKS